MKRLMSMLCFQRPHDSASEREFVEQFLLPYAPLLIDDAALVIEVPMAEGRSRTLFSSHIDTVHYRSGRQDICLEDDGDYVSKDDGEPLGADDAAGMWLMLEMIDHGVPGTYVFHRGEERGRLGSIHLADTRGEWLSGFDRAIAFDRRGDDSVITFQRRQRCCSDDFARALAVGLNGGLSGSYRPDPTGSYTDTASYTHLIPECTNVSCGYEDEHSGYERLHLPTLRQLRARCLVINWEALPVVRTTDSREPCDLF